MIRSCVFVLGLFLGALQPSLQAQTIAIATGQNANQVEQLGFPTTYSVNVTSKFSYSTVWAWRQNDGDCVSGYRNGVNQNGDSKFNFGHPGEFDIQCVITYLSSSDPSLGQPPGPQTVSKHVVIQKPVISSTLGFGSKSPFDTNPIPPPANSTTSTNTSLNGQPGVWIYFILQSNGKAIGPQLDPIGAQEKITNSVAYYRAIDDYDWGPTQSNALFFLGTAPPPFLSIAIYDFKWAGPPPGNPPPGPSPVGQFGSYTQELRLGWTTLCPNGLVTYSLGAKDYQVLGTNPPGQWYQQPAQ